MPTARQDGSFSCLLGAAIAVVYVPGVMDVSWNVEYENENKKE
jgi:hypothetical protein